MRERDRRRRRDAQAPPAATMRSGGGSAANSGVASASRAERRASRGQPAGRRRRRPRRPTARSAARGGGRAAGAGRRRPSSRRATRSTVASSGSAGTSRRPARSRHRRCAASARPAGRRRRPERRRRSRSRRPRPGGRARRRASRRPPRAPAARRRGAAERGQQLAQRRPGGAGPGGRREQRLAGAGRCRSPNAAAPLGHGAGEDHEAFRSPALRRPRPGRSARRGRPLVGARRVAGAGEDAVGVAVEEQPASWPAGRWSRRWRRRSASRSGPRQRRAARAPVPRPRPPPAGAAGVERDRHLGQQVRPVGIDAQLGPRAPGRPRPHGPGASCDGGIGAGDRAGRARNRAGARRRSTRPIEGRDGGRGAAIDGEECARVAGHRAMLPGSLPGRGHASQVASSSSSSSRAMSCSIPASSARISVADGELAAEQAAQHRVEEQHRVRAERPVRPARLEEVDRRTGQATQLDLAGDLLDELVALLLGRLEGRRHTEPPRVAKVRGPGDVCGTARAAAKASYAACAAQREDHVVDRRTTWAVRRAPPGR